MTIPLLQYLIFIPVWLSYPEAFLGDIGRMLFWKPLIVGRIIALIGIIILVVSAIQWLWYHRKKAGLFTKGLYSKIRHPQFLGIIITSLGLTIMVLTFDDRPFLVQQLVAMWMLQALGYMAIASFEERRLSKKFKEYSQYAQNVPFIFPVKNPKVLSELYFTLLFFVCICIILLLMPYNLIRI